MSNSQMKCPTRVQLDTSVRQLQRWSKVVETFVRALSPAVSTLECSSAIRVPVPAAPLEPSFGSMRQSDDSARDGAVIFKKRFKRALALPQRQTANLLHLVEHGREG